MVEKNDQSKKDFTFLREEIVDTQQKRRECCIRKMAYIVGLFGAGSLFTLSAYTYGSIILLFLTPLIALAFDIYIVSEDFCVKRIGNFLKTREPEESPEYTEWEKFVELNDDTLFPMAFWLTTVLIYAASYFTLRSLPGVNPALIKTWSIAILSGVSLLAAFSLYLRERPVLQPKD
ncbi:MAG: hypothetical protein A2255_06690 [Candidatus Melainabacteria bacterium RIFOXYA2_FULL_32_9]|nr:MAG: hypothetical protein A2255_06690 [Candidatus Melainabacteria bacterium RIFOXYA2_FULL_32_9]